MNAQFLACRQLPFCCVLTCQRETEKGDAEIGAVEQRWRGESEHANNSRASEFFGLSF